MEAFGYYRVAGLIPFDIICPAQRGATKFLLSGFFIYVYRWVINAYYFSGK